MYNEAGSVDNYIFLMYSGIMITDADIKKLSKVFATKDDLKAFATKDDLSRELKPVKKSLHDMKRDLKATIKLFDPELMNHKKRIVRIESHLGLPKFAD